MTAIAHTLADIAFSLTCFAVIAVAVWAVTRRLPPGGSQL